MIAPSRPPRRRSEAGLTLVEMMVALLVFSFALAGTLAFLRAEGRSFTLGSQRVAMLQNGRFAAHQLEQNLRTAGAGVPDIQPALVYLDTSVIAVNADYASNTPGDVFAVYHDPDAPDSATGAMTAAMRTTIPLSSFAWPDTTYLSAGVNSPAETIEFFFAPDQSTPRSDDYVLFRRVNALAPEVVSRNLLHTPGVPFFRFYQLQPGLNGTSLQPVPDASLPLRHAARIHGSPADTNPTARIDSVRGVQVAFTVTNGLSGPAERRRAVNRYIAFPNVGFATRKTCGDAPLLGTTLTATWNPTASAVDLTWNAAIDELSGEHDVERYVIWRRLDGESAWGDPRTSLPPTGETSYLFPDQEVARGARYVYALAAQDCTPTNSDLVVSAPVDIP